MHSTPSTTPANGMHRRVHAAGIWVLVLGLVSAVAIYVIASLHPQAHPAPDFSADRRFNFEMERVGGKSAVYIAAFNRWLGSLWEGTTLAYTVAALSVVVALVCFWIADLMSYPPLDLPPATPRSDRQHGS